MAPRRPSRGGDEQRNCAFDDAINAMLLFYADDVVCHPAPGWGEEGVSYRGHDGLRRLAAVWSERVMDALLDVHEVRDMHDRLVILAQLRGRDRRSGEPLVQPFGVLNTDLGEGGKVREVRFYLSWQEALDEAARTRERVAAASLSPT